MSASSTGKIAFCFPGQGSLEPGMGRDVVEASADPWPGKQNAILPALIDRPPSTRSAPSPT